MFAKTNSKKRGDIGLGSAIAWATENVYTVLLPLTDSQDYDLVLDIDGSLCKVQVKTCSRLTSSGNYEVQLSVKGGNRSGIGKIKKFDHSKVDFLFILTDDGRRYFISTKDFSSEHTLTLSNKYYKFQV